ncbi:MAG TPA: DUF4135 domain-containing protein, partial [Pseudonocardiaceae bacterium]
MTAVRTSDLGPLVAPLVGPALDAAAAALPGTGLREAECAAVHAGLATVLRETLLDKVIRVLVLELNAARVTGRLTAADPAARWDEWVEQATRPGYWESLDARYPTLRPRVRQLADGRCSAAVELARRFAADRAAIAGLPGAGDEPELTAVSFGAGDAHLGGRTVALLTLTGGSVVHKPRPVAIDAALAGFLAAIGGHRVRVPRVVDRDGYGWAEHIAHRHCAGDTELREFHEGLGHWLALCALLSGSDLHAENLIAAGPTPVVVDCETFFTPVPDAEPSGYGDAMDRALRMLRGSALRTGLLPGRGGGLGQRGVDLSAAGSLPGQQPPVEVPMVLGLGTDEATVGRGVIDHPRAGNGPSERPRLAEHWPAVLAGHAELTARLRRLDRAGHLEPLLAPFR